MPMGEITELIDGGNRGNGVDNAALFEAAYDELKKLARARLSRSGPLTLLDSTALVNEIWLRLSDLAEIDNISAEAAELYGAWKDAEARHNAHKDEEGWF